MKCEIAGKSFDISLADLRSLNVIEYECCPNGDSAHFKVLHEGQVIKGHICSTEEGYRLFIKGRTIDVEKSSSSTKSGTRSDEGLGPQVAPYACRLIAIHVEEGDIVEEGAPLFRIESMKMEHEVTARKRVKVTSVLTESGVSLGRGDLIMVTEEA